ncbi:NAD(P)/FAD-dependent oxidoreductase [Gemmobacter denitrificans]|uniref:FAD-binding oxidoreductase n=1 Tax=Gemmobacter denitrificans TaxID=3123040 RepID=A0ABU8BWF2_9RHOB
MKNSHTLSDPLTHGLWAQTAPAGPDMPPLAGAAQADVAIIGAGYTGLSAALHLARAGRSVTLIDAAEPGFGGAGRNVGLVNAGMWVQPDIVEQTLPQPYGARLIEALGNGPQLVFETIAREGIACEANPVGTLHCAVGAKGLAELRERHAQWSRRGAPVDLLTDSEAAALIGTRAYAGALQDRRAGTVQPLAYARGLAHAVVRAGGRLHGSSPATALTRHGDGWQITTPQGEVRAGWVILATDAYARHVQTDIAAEQVGLPYFNFATRPLTAAERGAILPQNHGCWDTREVLSSFRMDQAGRLVFGSVGALDAAAGVHRNWAMRAMTRLFPSLKGVEFETGWYGRIGMTADNLPRLHSFGPQALGVSGYNGRGISPGTVFGQLLARHVLGEIGLADMPLPVTTISLPSFPSLREAYYSLGAAALHLVEARF